MKHRSRLPIALTIAGSDSGGGAGLQADLKTFASLGIHGTSVVTCITAQNPRAVLAIQPCRPAIVTAQLEAVFAELPPAAVKTGMLFSRSIIQAVEVFFRSHAPPPLVVDPVMVSTSGARLLQPDAIRALDKLFQIASLLTPNLDEAQLLTGQPIRSIEAMRAAARELQGRYGCAVLLKGGHLRNVPEATDIYFDGRDELLLRAPFARGVSTHGTGCTYSAAITGYLALGHRLPVAVRKAKDYITRAIHHSQGVANHFVLKCR